MSEKELRSKVIRLAHSNPELRNHLLPLLKESKTADSTIDLILANKDEEFLAFLGEVKKALGKRDGGALRRIKPSNYVSNRQVSAELSNLLYAISYLLK